MKVKKAPYPCINVGIVDDHKSYSQALEISLATGNEFNIPFSLNNGLHLLQEVYLHPVDVLLLDIKMEGEDGFTLLKKVKNVFRNIKIIMISSYYNQPLIIHSFQCGAHGYFPKGSSLEELKTAIRTVYEKKIYVPGIAAEALYKKVMDFSDYEDFINTGISFAEKEKQIIMYYALDYGIQEISEKLDLSEQTIATYRKRLIKKTGTKSIAGLVAFALRHKVIILP